MQEEKLEKWKSHNRNRANPTLSFENGLFLKGSLFFWSQVILNSIFSTGNFDTLSVRLKTVIGTHCYNAYGELTCVLFPLLPSSFTGIASTQKGKAQRFFLF